MSAWSLVAPHRDIARADPLVFGRPRVPGVLSYSAHDTTTDVQHWTVMPLGAVTLTVDLITPDRAGLPPSAIIGPRDRPLTATQSGRAEGVTIALSLPAAHALLGPLHPFAGTAVGLSEALTTHLAEQLADLGSWPERFALLDRFLAGRLATGPRPRAATLHAWRRLTETRGTLRIAALATELGWSRQHLVTRFRHEFGLTPKAAARVLRLHHAVRLLPTTDLATAAVLSGYADQAHLNRDFRALTGTTPTGYLP
ncbi:MULTISPECIES: AraC family transcriptional regulator [unclassified Saccharothrix]|uniref:AraC family transcriptional regulator n=1 Tax=unclassified Saccharothrix TaxID=2593673 RepID=UPI00307CEB52